MFKENRNQTMERESTQRTGSRLRRWGKRAVLVLAGIVVLLFVLSYMADEPMRRYMENRINQSVSGYSVKIEEFHFNPLRLSVTFRGVRIYQDAHPKPPLAYFHKINANVDWGSIFSGNVVGDLTLDAPQISINLPQLREETKKEAPARKKGWQQAVKTMYPLEINNLILHGGTFTYIDEDPDRPLKMTRINIDASNIRNISSGDKKFPSPFHAEGTIFGTGRAVMDGRADFLAEPYAAVKGSIRLDAIPLDYFKPVLSRYNAALKGGLFSAVGEGEFTSSLTKIHFQNITLSDMAVDYTHTAASKAAEKKGSKKTKEAAKEASNKPGLHLRIDRMQLANCLIGYINTEAEPDYRIFLSQTNLVVTNLSNQFQDGLSKADLSGQFMGSGNTTAQASFRPEKEGPDFDLNLRIMNTNMAALNDMFRAYGNFDVSAGKFSFFTELSVKNREVKGYVKPLFQDIKVYDKRTDQEKGLFHKLYEKLVGGIANLLENRPREEVATKADISGTIETPKTSTWQVLIELVRNAFFKAILPGFEEEVGKQK